ncbi:MAG: helix-turn-helix transcriptional regulator [Bacillota bacterium]
MSLGNRLKTLREENNLSREELANLLGLSYWAISKYENNERIPDHETLNKIADYFKITIDYLLGRSNDPSPSPKTTIDEEWPEVANILRRNGKKLTPEDKKRIVKIIKAAVEDTDE